MLVDQILRLALSIIGNVVLIVWLRLIFRLRFVAFVVTVEFVELSAAAKYRHSEINIKNTYQILNAFLEFIYFLQKLLQVLLQHFKFIRHLGLCHGLPNLQ